MKMNFPFKLFFLFLLSVHCNTSNAQIWGLSGPWEVSCGIETVPSGNVRCSICLPFQNSEYSQNQFRMVFSFGKLLIQDNQGNLKNQLAYNFDPELKILKFNYNSRDYSFKVLQTGENYILEEEDMGVILLLKRYGYVSPLPTEKRK